MPTSPSYPEPGRNYDPFQHAHELGIQILFRPIRTENEKWMPEHQTLVIRQSMRGVSRRAAAAHGVAHALLAHPDNVGKREYQADRLAAQNLIDLDECVELMKWAPDHQRLALELGVTTRLVGAFLAVHGLLQRPRT